MLLITEILIVISSIILIYFIFYFTPIIPLIGIPIGLILIYCFIIPINLFKKNYEEKEEKVDKYVNNNLDIRWRCLIISLIFPLNVMMITLLQYYNINNISDQRIPITILSLIGIAFLILSSIIPSDESIITYFIYSSWILNIFIFIFSFIITPAGYT